MNKFTGLYPWLVTAQNSSYLDLRMDLVLIELQCPYNWTFIWFEVNGREGYGTTRSFYQRCLQNSIATSYKTVVSGFTYRYISISPVAQ